MKKILLIAILSFSIFAGYAQVGINTTSPHPSSALQIQSTKKGLLIPILKKDDRTNLKNPAKGLLVCDTIGYNIPMFYYYDGAHWITLNPLQATEDNSSNLKLSNGTTITFENDIIANKTFTVIGNTTLQKPVVINEALTVNSNINVGTNSINVGTVNTTNVNASTVNVGSGTTITSDKVKSNSFEGYGVTPIGGIIMWSGTTAPDGWVLCDGNLINDPLSTKDGSFSPDLKGRFIVGYSASDADYNSVANTGGAKRVILTGEQMPKHTHFGESPRGDDNGHSGQYFGTNGDFASVDGQTLSTTDTHVGYSGNNQPHENRPPYYVLAFIMRVK